MERRIPARAGCRLQRAIGGRAVRLGASAVVLVASTVAAIAVARVRPHAITFGQATFILQDRETPAARARLRLHEAVHRIQYRKHGVARFVATYLLHVDQRLQWEAEATAAELCMLRATYPWLVDDLVAVRSRTLRRYTLIGRVPIREMRHRIVRAFDDGSVCEALAARIAAAAANADGNAGAAAP